MVYLQYFIAALVIGLILAGVLIGVTIARYKMKLRATIYPLDKYAQMKLTESHDIFLRRSVVTRVIQTNNNNKKK